MTAENDVLAYMGGCLVAVWGIAHLVPTRNVVKDFGDISKDNRNIITMEWIGEGLTLIFLGVLLIGVTAVAARQDDDCDDDVKKSVYGAVVAMLNVMTVVSLLTGFQVNFPPFKICPVIFTGSSILVLLAMVV